MWRFSILGLLLISLTVHGAERRAKLEAAAVVQHIDRIINEKLAANRVPAAPRADDATFFRRLNLTLAGRIPVPSDVRAFLADVDVDKRAKAIERLVESAACTNHLTTTWRQNLLPEAATNDQVAASVPNFEAWLRSRFRDGAPFDKIVTELLTAPLDGRARAIDDPDAAAGPLAFFNAKEGKPQNLAAATSRVFLGVQLECAQCHDHPFGKWSRDQFWGMAAFFGGVEQSGGSLREIAGRRELTIPNSDRAVPATFLDDRAPEWRFKQSPRATLAAWVTGPENPFFARAMVNRLWAFCFGVGIVDPVDDFHDKNPASHPELLDMLARAFVESGYDVKFILRAICSSDAYQRTSAATETGQHDVRLFARYPVQGLSAEQLFDSFAIAVGRKVEEPDNVSSRGISRRQMMEAFAQTGSRIDTPTTIVQALTLMNGELVGAAATGKSGGTLAAVMNLPDLTPHQRIEALYLVVLGRLPSEAELSRSIAYVEPGDAARYGDVLWALLNGIEFRTNH